LKNGDVINLDITVYLDGYHGDCSEMFVAGEVDESAQKLLQATYDCWIKACMFVKPGNDYKDIGGIIEDHVTPLGFSTVRQFCGHGIGQVRFIFEYHSSRILVFGILTTCLLTRL
jgi:methionyl aminopeptidase